MLLYLLKSGACLAIFYGFYKLLLEKESIHVFKRYYLLVFVVLAFLIPLITFTEYIERTPQESPVFYSDAPVTNLIIEEKPINYLPIILWSIYGLGVLLFSIKFFKNLLQLLYKIKQNSKIKITSLTYVLLQDSIVPHTFFSNIFLNKQKFETHQIPREVLLHEETHAKQKHSLDVLFVEILNLLFWFNPLIYLIKKDIKLNHEFLADQAVLKQGIASSTYQNILLAFSSPDSYRDAHSSLANAINYSSIKKRFTVMKTQTSKQAFWLRSIIILPLLALLIYSFSDKKVVERTEVLQINNGEIKVHITKDKKAIIDNETIDFNSISNRLIKLTRKEEIKPLVYIEIEGPLNSEYLEILKNELQKSNLNISTIRATSIFFDENKESYKESQDYFKGTQYTADSITFINPKGEVMKGFSGPKIITDTTIPKMNNDEEYDLVTIKLPKSRGRHLNSNDLGKLDEFVKETFYEKENQQKATQDIVEEYKKKYNELEILKKTTPHYVYKTKTEQEKMNTLFSDLGGMYFRMTTANKQLVSTPEHPILPYTKLIRDGKEEYKKISELTEDDKKLLPPPPPPPIELEPKNPSNELLEAMKKFKEKGDAYSNAMQPYLKEGKGSISELKKMYDDVMILHKEYSDLAKKENVTPSPPPPPVQE